MKIRQASLKDIPHLVRLRLLSSFAGASEDKIQDNRQLVEEYFKKHLQDEDKIFLVALRNDEPVAIAVCFITTRMPSLNNPVGKVGYISGLYVDANNRRKGLATSLVQNLIEIGKEKQISIYQLGSTPMSHSIYLKLGFRESQSSWLELKVS